MKVLVIGGCGFIGSNLLRRLARGPTVELYVFDNESLGSRETISGWCDHFILGDIRDAQAVSEAVAGMDVVVNLAADTRVIDSIADPQRNFEINVVGGFNILEALRRHDVRRLVHASTGGAILGDAPPPVHELLPPRPLSPYGASKLMMEGYCSAYQHSYDLMPICLRFSNVYGPGSILKGSAVAAFLRNLIFKKPLTIYGNGEQTRDFIFIDDLCDGIIAAIFGEALGVIQLASGTPTTVNHLVATIAEVIAPDTLEIRREPMRSGEVTHTWCDISQAQSLLNFAPKTSLRAGLELTWRWFQQQSHKLDEATP